MIHSDQLARRAQHLSTDFPAAHFPWELAEDEVLFNSGFAFPGVLPDLRPHVERALTVFKDQCLQYSQGQGLPELRSWIADHMNNDGSPVTASNILVTHGAKSALDLICRLLLDEGDSIVVTAPMYFTAIPLFRNFGAKFLQVPVTAEGVDPESLDRLLAGQQDSGQQMPRFFYNVTDFHNPAGVTLSACWRKELLEVCQRHGVPVVEDNPYRMVRFQGEHLPTLKALDAGQDVLYVGTFSKLVAPGLRLGWVAADPALIARLIRLKSEGGSNPLIQRTVLEFCQSGDFQAHIGRVQEIYRAHRDAMVESLRRELPGAELLVPEGGYYCWVTLPKGMDDQELARQSEHAGVHIIPGSSFYAPGASPSLLNTSSHIRLSFSYATLPQIDDGIRRLGKVYRQLSGS